MEGVKIRIQTVKEAEAGNGILEGVSMEQINEGEDLVIGILERGTVNGKLAVMFCIKEGDKWHIAQLTEGLFDGLVSAVNGAKQRFAE